MIRVTVELLPGGYEEGKRTLGVATISNDMEDTMQTDGSLGSYRVKLSKSGAKVDETWKTGRVTGLPRKRLGGWDLLFRALRATVGDRNP